jgi:hypothetical protein
MHTSASRSTGLRRYVFIFFSSVAEPEPQGAGTFAGAGAIIMIQFSAPAPCYRLGILKSSEKSILKRKKITDIIGFIHYKLKLYGTYVTKQLNIFSGICFNKHMA